MAAARIQSMHNNWRALQRIRRAFKVVGLPVAVAVCMFALSGCRVARPNWRSPGTAQQQARAVQYDPFSDNDVAPEVVGGRPRAYAKQDPEPVRAETYGQTGAWRF